MRGLFSGTGSLVRLGLRLDRVRLPVWVVVLTILPAGTAANYKSLYPTERSLQEVSGVLTNPSLVALNGPLFKVSLGALTAWKIGVTELILIALVAVFTVVRHSRAEEEAGRLELLGATVVGRYAALTAALVLAGGTAVVSGLLITLGMIGTGLPAAGAVAMGLEMAVTGLAFAAVAGVAAQLTESARAASGIAIAVLGGAYLLRAVGDTGPTWVSWLSPVGWAMRVRPYATERWWVLLLPLALVCGCTAAAYRLVGHRDLGAGMVAQRPGPASAAPSLAGPLGLAWRLQRGLLLAWVVGLALGGAVMGGAAHGLATSGTFTDNQQLMDMLARLGGPKGIVEAYLAAIFGIIGITATAYTVQATLRMRAEETSGRLEPLLTTRTGRLRWAAGHLLFALLGTALLLAVAGVSAGLAYGAQAHDIGGQVPRMLGDALVQLPATWVLAGLGVALFGLLPRLVAVTWAGLIACFLLLEVGALLGLSQWLVDASPFAHVPKLPGSAFTVTPLLWLLAVAAALFAGGLAGFRRRDIG